MRGLVWDDLDIGSAENINTERTYNELRVHFLKHHVLLEVRSDRSEFFAEFDRGIYDFVLIDLFDKNGKSAGLEYAEHIRKLARDQNKDPDYPIFLISKEIDSAKITDLQRLDLIPIAKYYPANLIFHIVKAQLHPRGRWIAGSKVFIIGRQAAFDFSGSRYPRDLFAELADIVRESGNEPKNVDVGNAIDRDVLHNINRGILDAFRIIALLTPDEKIVVREGIPAHVARPNVYLELGIVGAQTSVLRKTLLLLNNDVQFPSDFGGRVPLRFEHSPNELRAQILDFLR